MAGTTEGGYKTVAKVKEKHGESFYARIGAKGGAAKTKKPKGFASMTPAQRSAAGKLGGSIGGYKTEAERTEARTRARLAQGKS